jgi:hypothetical protein
MTELLDEAIRAAAALPEADQDSLAAAMLEWIEDRRRWADSFARTHEALAELAREALAEHDFGHDPDAQDDLPADEGDESNEADQRGPATGS